MPEDWKPGRTVVVEPPVCGTKETPEWPPAVVLLLPAGMPGVTAAAGLTVGTGVCTGVGNGTCQADGDVGVPGVGDPGERGVGSAG